MDWAVRAERRGLDGSRTAEREDMSSMVGCGLVCSIIAIFGCCDGGWIEEDIDLKLLSLLFRGL
jgi:hypothetical protein